MVFLSCSAMRQIVLLRERDLRTREGKTSAERYRKGPLLKEAFDSRIFKSTFQKQRADIGFNKPPINVTLVI